MLQCNAMRKPHAIRNPMDYSLVVYELRKPLKSIRGGSRPHLENTVWIYIDYLRSEIHI